MGNVDVVIPVYKPDKKLQMVISRLMGQTIVPSNIFLIHTRSSEDDWHTEQLLQEVDRRSILLFRWFPLHRKNLTTAVREIWPCICVNHNMF